jgi:hypothetical protein
VTRCLLAFALLAALACSKAEPAGIEQAEFGVFFGGQVQELKEIQKELDPARQKHGFRITFAKPLAAQALVQWEISLPGAEKGGPRPALVGQAKLSPGERVLDVPLSFRPSDPLGSWHAKVTVDGRSVIDRDFAVVAAQPPPRRPLPPRAPGSAPPP